MYSSVWISENEMIDLEIAKLHRGDFAEGTIDSVEKPPVSIVEKELLSRGYVARSIEIDYDEMQGI